MLMLKGSKVTISQVGACSRFSFDTKGDRSKSEEGTQRPQVFFSRAHPQTTAFSLNLYFLRGMAIFLLTLRPIVDELTISGR